MHQQVGNFPGVTVECVRGTVTFPSKKRAEFVDVPGTYSLSAQSPDELIAVNTLLGRNAELGSPAAVIVIVDACNLRRNLYLAAQVLDFGIPTVIALNMMDLAQDRGIEIDTEQLAAELGAPVIPICAAKKQGLDSLLTAVEQAIGSGRVNRDSALPKQFAAALATLKSDSVLAPRIATMSDPEISRLLLDEGGEIERRLLEGAAAGEKERLQEIRADIAEGRHLATLEARARYAEINRVLTGVERRPAETKSRDDRIDQFVNHPVVGTVLFLVLMTSIFQAVFAWATPLMDLIDTLVGTAATKATALLPDSLFASFITDGIIAGIGSVLIFLPQILILSAFIIVLEDSGYMARAAFIMDRLMRWCGLSGHSFIPMLTSFACAVPGLMGTRVIGNSRDRLATIIAAPFMTCSARLPVYALLIAAFVPKQRVLGGLLNTQGLVLLGLYLLGIVGGIVTAFLVKKTILRGATPGFLMEMPAYRRPRLRTTLIKLAIRLRVFFVRAGTIIFAVAVVVWALATFPRVDSTVGLSTTPSEQLEQSYLGRAGKTLNADLRTLRVGLAGHRGRTGLVSRQRSRHRGTRHHLRSRVRRRATAIDGAYGVKTRRRSTGLYLAHGRGLTGLLCLLPAVRFDHGNDASRDRILALADRCLDLHDGARLPGSSYLLSIRHRAQRLKGRRHARVRRAS